MASQILFITKGHWFGGINGEKLLHVEDLNAVLLSFATDDHEIFLPADLTPGAGCGERGKASQIGQLSCLGDLGKGSAVLLADGNKLASVVGSPT